MADEKKNDNFTNIAEKSQSETNDSDSSQIVQNHESQESQASKEHTQSHPTKNQVSHIENDSKYISGDQRPNSAISPKKQIEHNVSGTTADSTAASSTQRKMKKNRSNDNLVQDEKGYSNISYTTNEIDLLENVIANAQHKLLIQRLLGCAYGQALGDSYGLSTEFEDRERVNRSYPDLNTLIPFPNYKLTSHNRRWARGDWTDDTDQWILILDTLTEHDGDIIVFAKKLSNWIRRGYPELGDHGGMGIGANVSQVVHSMNFLEEPHAASKEVWIRSNRQAAPNGAVMRCSASALIHYNDIDKVISTTVSLCKVTHYDPRCIASCLAVNLAIAYILQNDYDDKNIESLVARVQKQTIEILGKKLSELHREEFLWHTDKNRTLEELQLDENRSIGYTYKCLASGFYGLRSNRTFEWTLNDLIRYGGDADTNGAVCGTMYGARHGYDKLPRDWLRAMPYKKWFDKKLIEALKLN